MPHARLPLRPGTALPPPFITEQICFVMIPSLHLEEGATSFDQFEDNKKGTMSRAFFHFFLMVACEASLKDEFTLHIEGIYDEHQEIIGYRFFGFLTGTDGTLFVQIAASLLNRYEEKIKEPKTGVQLAKRFANNTLFPREAFYAVCGPDARLFGVAAAFFTGIEPPEGLSSEELLKFFLSPDTHFLCTADTACEEQADCGMYFQEPPGCNGFSVTFPIPNMVYTVPRDVLKFSTLFQAMLPAAQMQRARATKFAKVIIDAFRTDKIAVEPNLKRQRILAQLGAQEFAHPQAAAVEDFAGVKGTQAAPLTVFDVPREENKEILNSLAELEKRRQGRPRLGMIAPLTGSEASKVFREEDAKNQRLMARIYHLFQESAAATLKGLLSGDGLSPAYAALVKAGAKLNDPELSRWFYQSGGDWNLTCNLNTRQKLIVVLEQVCSVTELHEIGCVVENASLDSVRRDPTLHANVLIATENGATGKTNIVEEVLKLRVPGTIMNIVMATSSALLTGGINGQADQSGWITFYDEMPPESAAGDANGISKDQARKKYTLSNGGRVSCLYFHRNEEDGDRETKKTEAFWSGMEIANTNTPEMSHALRSRYIVLRPSEKGSTTGRRIESSMNEAKQTEEITGPLFDRVAKVFWQRHWLHFQIQRAIELKYIKPITMHGAALFLNEVIRELKKQGVLFETPRVNSNIHTMAKIECINEAYQNFLFDHTGLITIESLRKMEPLLFVTVDQMISAIMELQESICPNLPYGISCCIRDLYQCKAAAARTALDTKPFENLFALDVGSNQRQWSWFSVPRQELVEFVMIHVSEYTNSQPSKTQIYDAINALCTGTEAEYPSYGFIISSEGKFANQPDVVACPGGKVRTPIARLIDTAFRGVKQFEVHMGFVESVDTKKSPKETIVCAIKKALNYKHQFPHVFSRGKRHDSPELQLETATPDSDVELEVRPHVVANAHTQSFFPAYQKEVLGDLPSSKGRLQTCYDTYGLFRKNQQIYRVFSVDRTDVRTLLDIDDDRFFFGTPVRELTMDNIIIGPEQKRLLQRTLEAEGVDDLDFEPEDYMVDDEPHCELIKRTVPAQRLGFARWLDGTELMQQYRLICTHPYVIRDRHKRQAPFHREDYKHCGMYHWDRLVEEGLLEAEDAENKYKAIRHEPWVVEHRRKSPS